MGKLNEWTNTLLKNYKKISENNKVLIYFYILILLLCVVFRNNLFQNVAMITLSVTLVLILINKFEITDKKFKIICFGIVALNIILIYWGNYESIKLGFSDGLVQGQIGEYIYNDTYNYYYGSEGMLYLWKNDFFTWIKGDSSKSAYFYGFYNFYVIWNAIIRVFFGSNLNIMIFLKFQFSIVSIFLMYKVAKKILSDKYSRGVVIVANIFPGYLLVNISLMRDSLIAFLVLLATYILVMYEECLDKKKIIYLLVTIILLSYMRIYIGITLALGLGVYFYFNKINFRECENIKKLIGFFLIIFLIVGFVAYFMGYGFLGYDLIFNASTELPRFNADRVTSIGSIVFWTLYHSFLGGRVFFDYSGYIGNFLNSISNVFIMSIASLNLFVIFLKRDKVNVRTFKFILFTFIFSLATAGIVVFTFSSIVPRLYIAWFWAQVIVFFSIFQYLEENCKFHKKIIYIYILYVLFSIFLLMK